jgi:DNA polymerase-3 subunit delta
MYKKQFDTQLKQNIFYNGYMFYGEDEYLIETYTNKISMILSKGEEITTKYFDEYKFDDCVNFLSQSSLFCDTNILVIKTNKKIAKKEVDKLLEICQINKHSKVIFCCLPNTNVDFRSMEKSFTKKTNSVAVRFFSLFDNEALAILGEEARNRNIKYNIEGLRYLYTMHQKNLMMCVNDLNKLALLNEPLTQSLINKHCFNLDTISVEEFLIKLFSGQNINKNLFVLLEEGMNEIQLLTQTKSFAKELFMVNSYLSLHGKLDIEQIWGYKLPEHLANQRATLAKKFVLSDFKYIFTTLNDIELKLKTDKFIDTNSYLQSSFRKLLAKLR